MRGFSFALGLFGPFISSPGAFGTATQAVADAVGSGDFSDIVESLIAFPQTVIDGFVNGGYGPNLSQLVVPILISVGQFPLVPESLFPDVFAGGLVNATETVFDNPFPFDQLPSSITLGGTFDTLRTILETLSGGSAAVALAAPGTFIEDGVNSLVLAGATALVTITQLFVPLLEPVLGEQAAALPLLALGLAGPLISGPGAIGAATQDLVDAFASFDPVEIADSFIAAPQTVIDGFVNGGYGPDLGDLVGDLLPIPPQALGTVLSGGLINAQQVAGFPFDVTLPGTFATLRTLVEQILSGGAQPEPPSARITSAKVANDSQLVTVDTEAVQETTPAAPAGETSGGATPADSATTDTAPPAQDDGAAVVEEPADTTSGSTTTTRKTKRFDLGAQIQTNLRQTEQTIKGAIGKLTGAGSKKKKAQEQSDATSTAGSTSESGGGTAGPSDEG